MAVTIVLAYDISDNNTRARVAALISAWGDRIQRSVYRCLLTHDDLTELLDRIDRVINHNTDAVHVFVQCHDCLPKARHVGQATLPTPDPYWVL